MANRVLIGARNSQEGIYVSRPGKDVLTCSDDELIFKMDLMNYSQSSAVISINHGVFLTV